MHERSGRKGNDALADRCRAWNWASRLGTASSAGECGVDANAMPWLVLRKLVPGPRRTRMNDPVYLRKSLMLDVVFVGGPDHRMRRRMN
jgi:hypothetical protein